MKITCNETQARLIATALEHYSRHLAGQLEHTLFPELVWFRMVDEKKNYYMAQNIINLAKGYGWNLEPNESFGVGKSSRLSEHENKDKDLSYEMYKEILYYFYKDSEGMNVHKSKPCLKFTDEPTIKVE